MNLGQKFAEYYKEELRQDVCETPEGFYSYRVAGDEFFIADAFVAKNFRGAGLGKKIFNDCVNKAKEFNCKFVTANCFINENMENFNNKVAIFLAVGLKIETIQNNCIGFRKNLED